MQPIQRLHLGLRRLSITTAIGIVLFGAATSAEQWKPKKPTLPSAAIDNEGPIAIIGTTRTMPGGGQSGDGDDGGDQNREAAPPDRLVLPWRNVIRLDLILPIRTGPWMPPSTPKRPV